MPFLYADDMDEPLITDGFPSFDGGMVSAPAAKLLQQNQAAYLENMTIDTLGRICTRRGFASSFAQFIDQLTPAFLWSVTTGNASVILAAIYGAAGRGLYPLPNTTAPGILPSTYGDKISVVGTAVSGDLNGTTASGAFPASFVNGAKVIFTLLTGGAGFAINTIYYIVNCAPGFFFDLSATPGGPRIAFSTNVIAPTLITLADQNLPDVTGQIPSTALGVDGLYFGQTLLPLLLYKGGDVGSNLVSFPVAPSSGIVPNAPPKMSVLCWHQQRLFGAGASGSRDTLYSSNIGDVTTWNLSTGSLRIGDGDDDPIINISSWIDTALVIWKARSVWILDADPTTTPANWGVRNITRRLGLLSRNTVAAVNGDIWGLTTDGLRSIGRLFGTEQTVEIGNPLSQPVRDFIRRMTPGCESLAIGQYYKGRYFLSIAIDGSRTNNCLLVWRDISDSWEGRWTGVNVAHMAVDNTQSPPALLLGTTNGQVNQWLDNTPDFAADPTQYIDTVPNVAFNANQSVPVVGIVRTRASVMQDFLARKRGYLLDIEFYQSQSQAVAIYAILDGGTPFLIATVDSRGGTAPNIALPTPLSWTLGTAPSLCRRTIKYKPAGRFREVQFELRATDGRYMCISNLVATAFMETIKVQQ